MAEELSCCERAPVLWLLLPWMAGLSLGRVVEAPLNHAVVLGAGVGCTLLSAVFSHRLVVWVIGLNAGVILVGASWYQLCRNRLPEWEGRAPREVVVGVEVERLFAAKPDPRKASGLGRIVHAQAHLASLVGQSVQFSGRLRGGVPRLVRSAVVEMIGQLETVPRLAPPSTFEGYLSGIGVNFKLTRARITKERVPASVYWKWCDRMQGEMADRLARGLEKHPGLVAVLRAVLLGSIGELSERQDEWFTQSGTLHLFSVSGLHIGVMALALTGMLVVLRVPAWARFFVIAILIWLYVDITGRVPSAVRAFLMVMLFHGARVMRRPSNNLSMLVATAMIVLVVDPLQLFSASFQMSYGIVLALLALGLPMTRAWEIRHPPYPGVPVALWSWRHRLLDAMRRSSIGAVAVGLATMPVSVVTGLLTFALITPGALIANLVCIPLASIGLLGGFASIVAGACGETSLSILFNHAAALVLALVDRGAEHFVELPGVSITGSFRAPWIGYLVLVTLVALLLTGLQNGWSRRVGGFWPPFVFTGLVIIFLVTFHGG